MAEYRDHYRDFRAAGLDVAALAVDEPQRSEAVRRQYELLFPILCDTRREVVQRWGLLNREEKGGIAEPATFVLDRDARVIYGAADGIFARVGAAALLEALRGPGGAGKTIAPRRHLLISTLGDYARALRNALRFGVRSPEH